MEKQSGSFKILKKTLGARTTNGDMLGFDSPASEASAGWNWLPIMRGRNIGIWNNVRFRIGGNVSIRVDKKLLKNKELEIPLEGWNTSSVKMDLNSAE